VWKHGAPWARPRRDPGASLCNEKSKLEKIEVTQIATLELYYTMDSHGINLKQKVITILYFEQQLWTVIVTCSWCTTYQTIQCIHSSRKQVYIIINQTIQQHVLNSHNYNKKSLILISIQEHTQNREKKTWENQNPIRPAIKISVYTNLEICWF
jgi:hypothetical protein